MILALTGHEPKELVFDPTKPVRVLSRALDNAQARQVLGWEPRYSLEEGLRRTIDWFVSARPEPLETLL